MGREAGHEWNIQIKDNPTQVRDLLNHPVVGFAINGSVKGFALQDVVRWRLLSLLCCSEEEEVREEC